jgi:hypothetical protein
MLHDCCKTNLEYLKEVYGIYIFECKICKKRYSVYEIGYSGGVNEIE